jgi:hypothetical protein
MSLFNEKVITEQSGTGIAQIGATPDTPLNLTPRAKRAPRRKKRKAPPKRNSNMRGGGIRKRKPRRKKAQSGAGARKKRTIRKKAPRNSRRKTNF